MPFYKNTILIIFLFFPQYLNAALLEDNFKATWAGIEVIGTDQKTAEKVRSLMPFKIGDSFSIIDIETHRSMCEKNLKKLLPTKHGACAFTFFGDGTVFLNVDIIQNENKRDFRIIPLKKGKVKSLPKELLDVYEAWDNRDSELKSNGIFVSEKYDKGFRDFEDPVLHTLAEKLDELCSKHNDILMDILHYSNIVEDRNKAAVLLSWSRLLPENLSSILEWDILMDPDKSVRNNVARSFIYLIESEKNKNLLENLIPVYCKLATLPTHSDRNKALISLFKILKANPELAFNVNSECKKTIKYISEISILDNVGGVAKEINKIIESPKNA